MLIELCIAAIICIVVPFLIGDLLLHDAPLGKRYIMGIMVSLAIAQIIFLPVARFQQKFTVYYIIYISIIAVICAFSVIRNHKDYRKDMMSTINLSKIKEQISIWMILSIILIGCQVLRTTCGSFFVYADNVRYIPAVNDLLETDRYYLFDYKTGAPCSADNDIKYIYTTYFPYLGTICRLSGLHPAVLVQTLLPFILTITMYNLVWHYGFFLLANKKHAWIFVFFFAVLIETVGGYDYTYANHAVAGIYFGKKIIFTILLPFVLLFIAERSCWLEDKPVLLDKKDVGRLFIMMLGICAPSLMGTGLAPITLFTSGVVLSVRSKSLKPMGQIIIAMIPSIIMLMLVLCHNYMLV